MCEMYIPTAIKELINDHDYYVDDIGCSDSTVFVFKDKVLKISRGRHNHIQKILAVHITDKPES